MKYDRRADNRLAISLSKMYNQIIADRENVYDGKD